MGWNRLWAPGFKRKAEFKYRERRKLYFGTSKLQSVLILPGIHVVHVFMCYLKLLNWTKKRAWHTHFWIIHLKMTSIYKSILIDYIGQPVTMQYICSYPLCPELSMRMSIKIWPLLAQIKIHNIYREYDVWYKKQVEALELENLFKFHNILGEEEYINYLTSSRICKMRVKFINYTWLKDKIWRYMNQLRSQINHNIDVGFFLLIYGSDLFKFYYFNKKLLT